MSPNLSDSKCNQPYHLHPQDDQVSFANVDKNIKRSLEHTAEAMRLEEYSQKYKQKEVQQHIAGGSFQISAPTESSHPLGKKKRHAHSDDLVERNKVTLGRSISGYGSYVNMRALQQKKPHIEKKEATAVCPKETSDAEQSLIQQLKVTHIIEGSKEQGIMEPDFRSMEKGPGLQREGEPNEDWLEQSLESAPTMPSSTSHDIRVYPKLPPIMPKMRFSPSVNTINSHHRTSSTDFLAQMDDKAATRPNYKTYSLKEYKELMLDVKLQGLGPDYATVQKNTEKMIQQKLYSNAVRERNKKIRKIPFLLAKDPVGKDRKIARTKALEYAKTIAKPVIQPPQAKSNQKQESAHSVTPCLFSPTAKVDLLTKRHQEEKEALLRKM
ncbi:jhy protein homolog isoform X2 [Syngnathus acus]|uniref:jhy protein homolog isoform X2 n=1 Tax=Syngnathus acus TaxID=161584 RepID=UPI001885F25D|nr:jhy protein homolog isoform X2 [Syngnathus acus]